MPTPSWINVAQIDEFATTDRKVVRADDRPVLLLRHNGGFYAVDNRCPHMGFPLERGTVKDCILTCHWHHAQFDLASGGTFNPFADDVRAYPVDVRGDTIWIDITQYHDEQAYQRKRLHDGLEQNIRLVIAKAAISLLERGSVRDPFHIGLMFGTRYRAAGWGQGLTMLVCFMNVLPHLAGSDRARALYHGLHAVAVDSAGMAPRFALAPLPDTSPDLATLKRWFRRFIEVRDDEAAERCVVSAVRAGASSAEMADLLFAAITDHRYIQVGHPADFTNKALEALDSVGWEHAEPVLASLVRGIAQAARMEETSGWRYPVDLVALLDAAFEQLPDAVRAGEVVRATRERQAWNGRVALAHQMLGDDAQATSDALLDALRSGATVEEVAAAVSYAAALRIARFHPANEFGDWDQVLHTFTFANAVQQGIRRIVTAEQDRATPDAPPEERALPLLRGVFDAAISIYLDRFFNKPAARLPHPDGNESDGASRMSELLPLLDRQQQVAEAADLIARSIRMDDEHQVLATLGSALVREDRDFHTIQAVEAAFRQYQLLRGTEEAAHTLIAAGRYLAAHAPTMRQQGQTFQIAERLHRDEKLYEE
jgi:nitrite reductase/ring-hydroxylating ferredoxin subunit